MNIFEKATFIGLRFETEKGNISVEDVWRMPLESSNGYNLDSLAMKLHKALRDKPEITSFVNPDKSGANSVEQLSFDIVSHIINYKLNERKLQAENVNNAAKKAQILEIIKRKQDAGLEEKSMEELQKLIKDM